MPAVLILTLISSIFALIDGVSLNYATNNFHIDALSVQPDTHTYLFNAGGRKMPYSYVNATGTLVGFDVEFVKRVCEMAGKKCDTILAPFTDCIFTDHDIDYAGPGISARHFDGCPGYSITPDRISEFDFTLPYLETTASFTVAPGNPSGFDPKTSDYSAFTLLRLSGAPSNGACLTRLNKKYKKFLIAPDLPTAKEMVLNGTVDVLFSPRILIPGLDSFDIRVHCDTDGAGIMLRKGSDIPSWFNPAFKTLYISGEYSKMCAGAEAKYGKPVQCLPSKENASPELLKRMSSPEPPMNPERLWKFVVSGRVAPYSFRDEEGNLVGWTKDFVEEVCRRANKRCVLMLATIPECTYNQRGLQFPGRGLMENWFDACTGYYDTKERENSWDVTEPYLISNASFYVRPGNPTRFDPSLSDFSSYVLVRAAGTVTNDHCLNRLHKKFGVVLTASSKKEAMKWVLNGTADAWFTKKLGVTELEQLPGRFHCENVGTSILVKKGSDLPSWWDPAFREYHRSGEFNKFCDEQGRYYNFDFSCIPPPADFH